MKKEVNKNIINKKDSLPSPTVKIRRKDVKLNFLYLSLIFVSFLLVIIIYIFFIPELSIESKRKLKTLIPRNFKDLRTAYSIDKIRIIYDSLISYKQEHGFALLVLLSLLYIFYHSFPLFLWWMTGTGSAITILIGSLYNYTFSILYCSLLSSLAPLITYFIFNYFGKCLIEQFFKSHLIKFNEQINKRVKTKYDLFVYIAILRLTPIFPNTVINILVATLSLPVITFFLATYIGLIPNTIILVSLGKTISSLAYVDVKHHFYAPLTLVVLLLIFQKIVKYKYRDIAA
ncbi:SNARE associated Golgi protein, putative [Hepatocystis sp. ex Piliocolobus tephrosceles]|nr:SNARE associated Golgi protein, putative [Hepatocystis sp. ex Piliocolobus tephrosceles]